MDPNAIKFVRHATADEVVSLFFAGMFSEFGPLNLAEVGIDTSDNTQLSGTEMLSGIKEQHLWGFADTTASTVHWWADGDATTEMVAHLLAHEIGHLIVPQYGVVEEDEANAEQFGQVAGIAVREALKPTREPHA
jgi:predicted HD phosphohydrolase